MPVPRCERIFRLAVPLVLSCALFAVAGCGDADALPRVAVNADVTVDGKPVELAIVTFEPMEGTKCTLVNGTVLSGRMSILERVGPVPGRYTVTLTPPFDPSEVEEPGMGGRTSPVAEAPRVENVTEEKKRREFQIKVEVPDANPAEMVLEFI